MFNICMTTLNRLSSDKLYGLAAPEAQIPPLCAGSDGLSLSKPDRSVKLKLYTN